MAAATSNGITKEILLNVVIFSKNTNAEPSALLGFFSFVKPKSAYAWILTWPLA
jgi:hypothetical protein